mmetsp:Transcript_16948/g.28251  ORF Transcript_16948/g.28251 Transcript_16948/m.28251 type:complete len:98 (-) Transcript_16948:83-376(-)
MFATCCAMSQLCVCCVQWGIEDCFPCIHLFIAAVCPLFPPPPSLPPTPPHIVQHTPQSHNILAKKKISRLQTEVTTQVDTKGISACIHPSSSNTEAH